MIKWQFVSYWGGWCVVLDIGHTIKRLRGPVLSHEQMENVSRAWELPMPELVYDVWLQQGPQGKPIITTEPSEILIPRDYWERKP